MKSVAERVYDEIMASRVGRRVTSTELSEQLAEKSNVISSALTRFTVDGMLKVVDRQRGRRGGRMRIIYEVTGLRPKLWFRQRPRDYTRKKRATEDENTGQQSMNLEPGDNTFTLSNEELDAMAVALLDRVPDEVLLDELDRRTKVRPKVDLPPRVAALIGREA